MIVSLIEKIWSALRKWDLKRRGAKFDGKFSLRFLVDIPRVHHKIKFGDSFFVQGAICIKTSRHARHRRETAQYYKAE